MKRFLPLLSLSLLLAACVDTTGISPQSSKVPAGNAQSAVTVTEFGDLQCPACRAAYLTLNKPLMEKYKSQVRFDFVQFPLQSLHRYAMDLAEASECIADQGKFWEFVDIDYNKQPDLKDGTVSSGQFRTIVAGWIAPLKLDNDLYSRCTRSHIKRKAILSEYDQGVKLGVNGTPTFFVNGKKVDSTIDAISAAIDGAMKGAAQRL